MQLPKLKVLNNNEVAQLTTCNGLESCKTCELYAENGGRCSGCTVKHKAGLGENFSSCYQQCNTCVGYKVNVTGICCRSPLKNMYLNAVTKGAKDWNKPSYTYTERPLLEFDQRAVFYISSGGVNTIAPGKTRLVDESHEVVAVNLTRVWGGNGFYSEDLKDYLHLSKKTKLILMTMTLDDMLEKAWNKESYGGVEFSKVGLDAWMPLSFSAYLNEAHMHQYYQLLRTLYATERGKGWFVTGDHGMPGLKSDDLILEAVEKIPQMVFNAQFATKPDDLRFFLLTMVRYHKLIPAHVPFWLVGASNPSFLHNVRKQVGKRPVYYVSAKPLYLASKGQALTERGTSIKSKEGKHALLQNNYRAFADIVKKHG